MRVTKWLKCSRQVLSIHNGASYPCQMALGYRRCSVGFALAPWPLAGTDDVCNDIHGLGTFADIGHPGASSQIAILRAGSSRRVLQIVAAASHAMDMRLSVPDALHSWRNFKGPDSLYSRRVAVTSWIATCW